MCNTNSKQHSELRQMLLWLGALVIGAVIGLLGIGAIDRLMSFIATVYTRLFQFLAVPTIALAVINTIAMFGRQKDTGRIFRHAVSYTLLTTIAASLLGMVLYLFISPGNLPASAITQGASAVPQEVKSLSYYDHILSVIPNNIIEPVLSGNVLSILLIAFAVGFAITRLPESPRKKVVEDGLAGLQDILFMLIHWIIWTLPLGILAFSAQLSSQMMSGFAAESLGRYIAVILGGNLIQMFIVLPLFLIGRGLNPLKVMRAMSPAVLMALFTKSSAATLPVTIESAETRLGASSKVARFVLPICTTINMNGCAAFIFVTSIYLMQNGGMDISIPTMLLWVLISVVAAVGNAGVPMGCFFLTISLMAGMGAPIALMGIIMPIYTILDMVETAENVWSDSCVCAMTDRDVITPLTSKHETPIS